MTSSLTRICLRMMIWKQKNQSRRQKSTGAFCWNMQIKHPRRLCPTRTISMTNQTNCTLLCGSILTQSRTSQRRNLSKIQNEWECHFRLHSHSLFPIQFVQNGMYSVPFSGVKLTIPPKCIPACSTAFLLTA